MRIISRPLAAPLPTASVDAQLRSTSLYYCVSQGYVSDVERLLGACGGGDAGAMVASGLVNAPLEEGETLLHVAADAGLEAIASLLLGAGARVNAVEEVLGRTPLHYAVAQGHWAAATLLLASGADAGALDKGGLSALAVLQEEAGSAEPPPQDLLLRLQL